MSRIPRIAGLAASLVAVAVVWGVVSLFTPASAPLSGKALVIDGDTLRIGSARIRLAGIDAPELDQTCIAANGSHWPCGEAARDFLIDLIHGDELTCAPSGRDRYARIVARCQANGDDLGTGIVAAGWAVPEPAYAGAGLEARAKSLGIWAGTFESPADWRRDHGEPGFNPWDWLRGWFGGGWELCT